MSDFTEAELATIEGEADQEKPLIADRSSPMELTVSGVSLPM
jgi:hypothetical protein